MQPVIDRFGLLSTWEDVFHGGHVFLILGGPSIYKVVPDTKMLQDRGIATFGVNNVSATIRTNFWTYGDSTRKFHDAIWADHGCIKFVPCHKLHEDVFTKRPGEKVQPSGRKARDFAGIVGIERNSHIVTEGTKADPGFLWQDTVNWGEGAESICNRVKDWMQANLELPPVSYKKGNGKTVNLIKGQVDFWRVETEIAAGCLPRELYHTLAPYPKVLSTMFQAVRLCYFLGFRNVYLLGADFSMDGGKRYSFDETGNQGTVRGNNSAYPKLNQIFHALRPAFDAAGYRVFNCNPESRLTAFDFISFDNAYAWARENMPKEISTSGWYERD
jgi:hypothetical protein